MPTALEQEIQLETEEGSPAAAALSLWHFWHVAEEDFSRMHNIRLRFPPKEAMLSSSPGLYFSHFESDSVEFEVVFEGATTKRQTTNSSRCPADGSVTEISYSEMTLMSTHFLVSSRGFAPDLIYTDLVDGCRFVVIFEDTSKVPKILGAVIGVLCFVIIGLAVAVY